MSDPSDGSVPSRPTAALQPERRANPRRRMLKAGILGFKSLHSALPCSVRDLSPGGARIRINAMMMPPSEFRLLIEMDGTEADCQVVWRRGTDAGLRFQGPLRQGPRLRAQVIDKITDKPTPTFPTPGRPSPSRK